MIENYNDELFDNALEYLVNNVMHKWKRGSHKPFMIAHYKEALSLFLSEVDGDLTVQEICLWLDE